MARLIRAFLCLPRAAYTVHSRVELPLRSPSKRKLLLVASLACHRAEGAGFVASTDSTTTMTEYEVAQRWPQRRDHVCRRENSPERRGLAVDPSSGTKPIGSVCTGHQLSLVRLALRDSLARPGLLGASCAHWRFSKAARVDAPKPLRSAPDWRFDASVDSATAATVFCSQCLLAGLHLGILLTFSRLFSYCDFLLVDTTFLALPEFNSSHPLWSGHSTHSDNSFSPSFSPDASSFSVGTSQSRRCCRISPGLRFHVLSFSAFSVFLHCRRLSTSTYYLNYNDSSSDDQGR